MKIVVCLKQVLDPDIPARDFRVDVKAKQAERGSAKLVMDLYSANALETALQFRDAHGGSIVAVAVGPASVEEILRKALALKVDEAVHVQLDNAPHPDPFLIARLLASAVRKIDGVDLVLTGRESADWGGGQTGGLLAEELGWPNLSFVDRIEPDGSALKIGRQTDTARETYSASAPLVLTITNDDHNIPRPPKTKDVMMSARKPIAVWTSVELGIEANQEYSEVASVSIPERKAECEFIAGDTLDERIAQFAARMIQAMDSA